MRSDETGGLAERRLRAVDDEGHKRECVGQVLCVEGHDEEGHLPGGVLLGVGVCVREGEGGEEGVAAEEDTCKCLVCNRRQYLFSQCNVNVRGRAKRRQESM